MSILTITLNPCIDKTCSVERVIPERKLAARDVRRFPGGGGINVARTVCLLGGRARALWARGGPIGAMLADLLDDDRIDHTPVDIEGDIRENLIVRDSAADEQYRFGMPGPELTAAERDRWEQALREHGRTADYVVFSGSLPGSLSLDWYAQLIAATPKGAKIVVDTKKDALARALDVGVYLIKPNVHELEELLGRELGGDEDIASAAQQLIARGAAEVVLVSLGRGGALLATAEGARRFAAPSVHMRSKVGAGDSMVGGLVKALSGGASLAEAVRLGVAAGAAAVMTEGTGLCRREDTERLLHQIEIPKGVTS